MQISDHLLDAVERALPERGPGLRPHQVHERMAFGARTTVRHALREMVACGRAEFEGEVGYRRYRRKGAV